MVSKRELLLLFFLVFCFHSFSHASPVEVGLSVPMKAIGTGMTTGHIADLIVKNKSHTALQILPQRVFIPSSGQYQPYIADIPHVTIGPGTTDTLHLQGYCTDVHLPAAPAALELIPISKWVPIRQPDSTLIGSGIYLVTQNSAIPFTKDHIGYIITSSAYSPLYPPPDTLHVVTWPGTDLPTGGSMNHVNRPDLYASIIAKVLESLEAGADEFQERKNYATPYTVTPGKEREAIIQQLIWIYATALAGKKYGKEEFRAKVYDEFKSNTAYSEIPDLEKMELDEGIDEFWKVFMEIADEKKLFINKESLPATGALVDLPIDTIVYPWSKVQLTDIIMKPGFVKAIPLKVSSPVIPIIAAATSVGSLLFIAFHDQTGDTACAFTVSLESIPASCGQTNGAVTVTTSVDAEYDYIWSNGSTEKNLIGIPAGNYGVTVTRTGTTCGQAAQTEVANSNASFETSITTTDAHCGQQDGSASVTVDPPGIYAYSWSNGSMDQNQINLPAGNYTLIVTSGGGCADTTSITIHNVSADFTIHIESTPSKCGAADGSLNAIVDPPGEYQYQWSEGSTTNVISELTAGTYRLTVTDIISGCSSTMEAMVESSTINFAITVNTMDANCGLSDGSADIVVDPPGEYNYDWSNGQSTPTVSGLSPGTYSLTVSVPSTQCVDSTEVTIGELPPNYTINTSSTPASCGLNDGTAIASVDPPGAYEFNWSNGQSGSQISSLAPGNYTVTVSLPGTICVQTSDITVGQLPPSFSLSSASTPASCGLSDGTASAVVDPPGEYNYMWASGQTTMQITGLSPGIYEVTVSIPGTNCVQGLSITVEQLPPSFTINTTSTLTHCGLSDGTAIVVVDPPGEYNYVWSNGQTTASITGLAAGSYSVTVTIPGSSCQQIATVTIDKEPASFTVNTSSTPAQCGVNDGTAIATVDPPGEYNYQWSGGQSGVAITGLLAGQYIVSVSLVGSSCFVTDTIVVDQLPLSLNASFSVTPADCGVANGSAVITIDPAGNYTYTWSNQQVGNILQQVPTGAYDVTVTDANSCTAVFSTSIGENVAHYLDINSFSPATCIGGGEISFTLSSPGSGHFSVEISTPGGQLSLTLSSGSYLLSSFTNLFPGNYNFVVFDQGVGGACTENQSVQIENQTPSITTTDDVYSTPSEQPISGNVLQNDSGLNLQLTAVSNIVGGNVTFSADGNFNFTPNAGFSGAGSFVYTVMDACGNTATGMAIINVQMVACNITITSTLTPANCDLDNGSISISVNQPGNYQYTWSNGQTGTTINNIPAGSYTVTILETVSGCTENFTLNLTEYPANYISNIIITQPTGSDPGEIQFTLNTQGGVPFLSVSVDHPNGLQTFTIEPGVVVLSDYIEIVPGSYTIEAFIGDAGPDCVDEFSAVIITPPFAGHLQRSTISLGVAFVTSPITTEQAAIVHSSTGYWNMSALGILDYHIAKKPQRIRMLYSPGYNDSRSHHPSWMQMEHLSELIALHQERYVFSMNGGFGIRHSAYELNFDPAYICLNAASQIKLGKLLHLQAEVSMRGWSTLEPLQWMINATFPFLK